MGEVGMHVKSSDSQGGPEVSTSAYFKPEVEAGMDHAVVSRRVWLLALRLLPHVVPLPLHLLVQLKSGTAQRYGFFLVVCVHAYRGREGGKGKPAAEMATLTSWPLLCSVYGRPMPALTLMSLRHCITSWWLEVCSSLSLTACPRALCTSRRHWSSWAELQTTSFMPSTCSSHTTPQVSHMMSHDVT